MPHDFVSFSRSLQRADAKRVLVSYVLFNGGTSKQANLTDFDWVEHLTIDSGAYSAWKSGSRISLHEYCYWLKSNLALRSFDYFSLDVIPSDRGPIATGRAARDSFLNWTTMRRTGLNPIPVFHQGEDWDWLAKYLDAGASYIGLSSAKELSKTAAAHWLLQACETAIAFMPHVRLHGLGVASPAVFKKLPWYSVDSSSWAVSAGVGTIYVPPKLQAVSVSKGFDEGPNVTAHLAEQAEQRGYTLQELRDSWEARAAFNAQVWIELERQVGVDGRKPLRKTGFF
jgi:hypothetical protein